MCIRDSASAYNAAFVPGYRCGAVPDSHRVPSFHAATLRTAYHTTSQVSTLSTPESSKAAHIPCDKLKVLSHGHSRPCLLYTSDAADERSSVDLGGSRTIKKKKTNTEVEHRAMRDVYLHS